jgi:hypothetical protein
MECGRRRPRCNFRMDVLCSAGLNLMRQLAACDDVRAASIISLLPITITRSYTVRLQISSQWLGALPILLILGGCAGAKVGNRHEIAASGLSKPQQVLIHNFAVSPEDIKQNSGLFARLSRNFGNSSQTEEKIEEGREVADALATELTLKIRGWGLNAIRADQTMPLTQGAILVTGHFVNIDEGNRLRRTVIGFGAGQSAIDSRVRVLAPSSSGYAELIAFDAHADSGEMPGAVVMGPAGAAAGVGTAAVVATNAALGAAKNYRSAAAQQAKTMADSIAGELAKYFARQGWISPNQAK